MDIQNLSNHSPFILTQGICDKQVPKFIHYYVPSFEIQTDIFMSLESI